MSSVPIMKELIHSLKGPSGASSFADGYFKRKEQRSNPPEKPSRSRVTPHFFNLLAGRRAAVAGPFMLQKSSSPRWRIKDTDQDHVSLGSKTHAWKIFSPWELHSHPKVHLDHFSTEGNSKRRFQRRSS